MITGIHHVAISVPDLDKAVEFYHGTLGLKKIFANSRNGDLKELTAIGLDRTSAKVQMLKAGNAYLELWEYIEPKPEEQKKDYSPADHGIAHIALQVTDINDEFERLKTSGMTFHQQPVDLGNSSAIYGRDPFGNIIELYEVTGERSI